MSKHSSSSTSCVCHRSSVENKTKQSMQQTSVLHIFLYTLANRIPMIFSKYCCYQAIRFYDLSSMVTNSNLNKVINISIVFKNFVNKSMHSQKRYFITFFYYMFDWLDFLFTSINYPWCNTMKSTHLVEVSAWLTNQLTQPGYYHLL